MITIDRLRIEEREETDFVKRDQFPSEKDFQRAFEWGKDHKLIIGSCLVMDKGVQVTKSMEYKISKWVLKHHPEEARKSALVSMLATLGESILQDSGGVI